MSGVTLAIAVWLAAGLVPQAAAPPDPPPATRADALRLEREEKAATAAPARPGVMERVLLKLENDRVFERLLNPPEGIHPKIGHITPGSSLSLGVGYRRPRLFGRRAEMSLAALGSFRQYWLLDARLKAPELSGGAATIEAYGQRYDYPQESFFGLGPDSLRRELADFRLQNTVAGVFGELRPASPVVLGGRLERQRPRVGRGTAGGVITLQDRFADAGTPGLSEQPDFNHVEVFAALDTRVPRGNARRGGRYQVSYGVFDDRDLDRYSFRRVELEVRHYVPFLEERRVLAFRALASASDASEGHQVPFYLMRTLGGPDDLRGFRRYRFRDRNLLLLQAEYRWEIWSAVDAAFFIDAGQVSPRVRGFALDRFETDYGFGMRFGSANGVFLRIEGAFGSRDGKHLIFRFGPAF